MLETTAPVKMTVLLGVESPPASAIRLGRGRNKHQQPPANRPPTMPASSGVSSSGACSKATKAMASGGTIHCGRAEHSEHAAAASPTRFEPA